MLNGMLKVVAGAPIRAGEQIFIVYGDAKTSNVELAAHYGFVDSASQAAQAADRALVRSSPDAVAALRHTSAEEDRAALAAEPPLIYQERLAIGLRLALKKAAAREGVL